MQDKYQSFEELSARRPNSFTINLSVKSKHFLIFTPHGGGIEPGTTELCQWFGKRSYSYYSFTGVGKKCKELHITSTRFDEPRLMNLLTQHTHAISFHGMTEYMKRKYKADIFLGGLNIEMVKKLESKFLAAGYKVSTSKKFPNSPLAASNTSNVTNKCIKAKGVQIELSESIRRGFFKGDFKFSKGRKKPTNNLFNFCTIILEALIEYKSRDGR